MIDIIDRIALRDEIRRLLKLGWAVILKPSTFDLVPNWVQVLV